MHIATAPIAYKVGIAGLPFVGKAVGIPLVLAVGAPIAVGVGAAVATHYALKRVGAKDDSSNGTNGRA